jgi:hypothetical protein
MEQIVTTTIELIMIKSKQKRLNLIGFNRKQEKKVKPKKVKLGYRK